MKVFSWIIKRNTTYYDLTDIMGLLAKEGEMPSSKRLTTYLATLTFVASSIALYGNATFTAFGYDIVAQLTTNLWSATDSAIAINYAHVLSFASILGVYYGASHPDDFADFTDQQGALGLGTTALVFLTVISPSFNDLVTATNQRALAFVGVLVLGWVSIIESNEIKEAMGR